MKVLFDHQIFASQRYGGISRYFSEIARNIAESGNADVHVLCPLYVNEYIRSTRRVKIWGRHIPQPPYSVVLLRNLNAVLAPLYREARMATNIYHETYFSRLRIAPNNTPVVVTVHDMIHEKFYANFNRLDRTREAKKAAVERADHVICVSENTRRDLLELYDIDSGRVSVVYHGSSFFVRDSALPRHRSPQLLYIGSRGFYKNFANLIRALGLSRLTTEGFSLVCFGGGPLSRTERAMVDKLGLQNHIRQVTGGDDVLFQLLQQSAALVYPSLYEGFGIPLLEAMSCGCPVACSNTSSLPEIAQDAAVFFDPTDAGSIRDAIESIVFSPTRSAELAARGLRRSLDFSWGRSAAATLDAYRTIS